MAAQPVTQAGLGLRALGLALCLLVLNLTQASATEWLFRSSDDGSFFVGGAGPDSGPSVFLVCGERSPQGLSPTVTGNMEPDITPRDSFRIYLSADDIGMIGAETGAREDVMFVTGTTGYRLRDVIWNELFWTWETDLQAADPMFQVLAAQPSFELRSNAGTRIVTTNGMSRALGQLTGYCQAMFTSIGQPWVSVPAAATTEVGMRQVAEAAVRTGCGGAAQTEDGAFLSGDIDGDGRPDIVVDWRKITCSGGYPRPFCGASMCSANVYLSGSFPARQRAEELLALGVRLIPLDNGTMGVATGGSLAACQGRGETGCELIWYWTGQNLERLN